MNLAALQLVRGTEKDILFVMATERLPGYDKLVGRWSDAQHRAALADPRYAYFIGCFESEPVGFAIVRDWASPERVHLLNEWPFLAPASALEKRFSPDSWSSFSEIPMPTGSGSVCSQKTLAHVERMKASASKPKVLRAATRFLTACIGMS